MDCRINGVTYTHEHGNFLAKGDALALAENVRDWEAVRDALPWKPGRPEAFERVAEDIVDAPRLDSFMNGDPEHAADYMDTFEDVLDALRGKGWERGVSRLSDIVTEVMDTVPLPQSIRDQVHWGDQGDEIDIHRVYAGQFDRAWSSERGGITSGVRIVKLVVPFGCGSSYSMEEMQWMGASAVVLCDVLERAGFRVEVQGLRGNEHSTGLFHGCLVTLKEAGEYVNLSSLAFMLCHPVTWRTVGIRQWPFSPTKWSIGSWGQPRYVDQSQRFREAMSEIGAFDENDDTILLGSAFNRAECVEATTKALKRVEQLITRDEEIVN
jgi:hypothetical protein